MEVNAIRDAKEANMKRLSLVALLLLGSAAAHADNDIYTNMLKRTRGSNF